MKQGYKTLISHFRQGTLGKLDPATLPPTLSGLHAYLEAYSHRNWEKFHSEEPALTKYLEEESFPIGGDLLFLRATAYFLASEFTQAGEYFNHALSKLTPDCLLYSPELIQYNQYCIRVYNKDFNFGKELPLLRSARKGAQLKGNESLLGIILNAYGNHYFYRGSFRRALQLFLAAEAHLKKDFRLNNYLETLANGVRASLRIGSFRDSERLMNQLNKKLLEVGDAAFKERFDRVYAEYLFAVERHDESATHLEFCIGKAGPLEQAQMLLLKAQIHLAWKKPGAVDFLKQSQKLVEERNLSEDRLFDFYSVLSSAQLNAGDIQGSYQSVLKAESLSYWNRDPHLRAQVMFQKAKININQGQPEPGARLLSSVLRVCLAQEFTLLSFQILKFIFAVNLEKYFLPSDLVMIKEFASRNFQLVDLIDTRRVLEHFKVLKIENLSQLDQSPVLHVSKEAQVQAQESIVINKLKSEVQWVLGGKTLPIIKTHLMTGRLLCEFLEHPNQDLTLDQIHLDLWGGPVRNESHVQKLKTLVSRLRTELKVKQVPAEVESRQYATYRISIALLIVWS